MTKLTQYCNYHWYVQESESRTRNQRATLANTDSQVWVFSHLFNPVKSDFPAFVQFIWAGVNTVISGADQDNRNNSLERKWSCSGPKQTLERFFFLWWERDPTSIWPNYQLYGWQIACCCTCSILAPLLCSVIWRKAAHLYKVWSSMVFSRRFLECAFGTVLV